MITLSMSAVTGVFHSYNIRQILLSTDEGLKKIIIPLRLYSEKALHVHISPPLSHHNLWCNGAFALLHGQANRKELMGS